MMNDQMHLAPKSRSDRTEARPEGLNTAHTIGSTNGLMAERG